MSALHVSDEVAIQTLRNDLDRCLHIERDLAASFHTKGEWQQIAKEQRASGSRSWPRQPPHLGNMWSDESFTGGRMAHLLVLSSTIRGIELDFAGAVVAELLLFAIACFMTLCLQLDFLLFLLYTSALQLQPLAVPGARVVAKSRHEDFLARVPSREAMSQSKR